MPRLFADTCIFAHGLGIKYVWIDSICIRQNDPEEWKREAPQMVRYYQNAWVTVIATNSAVDSGLPNMQRTELVPMMARLPYMDRNGEQQGYFYLQAAQPDVLQKDFSVGVAESKLLQRGWVFQEWRLSRRIIAFSDSESFLHCHTLGSTSLIGDHFNGVGVQLGHGPEHDRRIMQRLGSSPSIDWEDIVSEYSGLGLTFLATDRLMALAGVASEVGLSTKALKDASDISSRILSDHVVIRRYVCGLWLINIHEGLLWEQAKGGSRERLPGIPTWSWASMARHVTDEDEPVLKDNKPVLVGMSVRWPKSGFSQRQRHRVCAIHKVTTIPVDDQTWLPQFNNRPVPDVVPQYEYGNENRFVVLTIHSSLQPVQIESLLSEQDAYLADELTSTSSNNLPDRDHPWGTDLWRGICLPTDPSRIVGWASVEHPELQSDEKIASCSGSIYALLLERCVEKGGWFRWGNALFTRVVFTVLLVRRVTIPGFDESFERVGVGRLFSEEVDKKYVSASKTTISLV